MCNDIRVGVTSFEDYRRADEVCEYARRHNLTRGQAIVALVNKGLSHQDD